MTSEQRTESHEKVFDADEKITPAIEQKRKLYRAGRYICPPPDVCSAQWNEDAWIAFVDAFGKWSEK